MSDFQRQMTSKADFELLKRVAANHGMTAAEVPRAKDAVPLRDHIAADGTTIPGDQMVYIEITPGPNSNWKNFWNEVSEERKKLNPAEGDSQAPRESNTSAGRRFAVDQDGKVGPNPQAFPLDGKLL